MSVRSEVAVAVLPGRTESICAACGERNPAGARFCAACGAMLGTRPAVAEERKVVSVLFVDLVGFTHRAEQLDPEEIQSLLAPYWEHVREELERHSGNVEKFVGDAVMALFGAPVVHEDDAERAVRAALAIRAWAREEPEFDVRVGVTTGEVVVRLHARPAAGEGMVVGDVVNTCARLQQAAPVNAVLVDQSTYEATKDVIEYRRAEPVVAKGKALPVPAWEPQTVRRRITLPRTRTPFVGRSTQLALLRDVFRRVVDERSPQLVTIVGPPGIGKTRLVEELHGSLAASPEVEWLHGRALPYGDRMTLGALSEIVKRYAGVLETDTPARAGEKLRDTTHRLIADPGEAQSLESHLRALVGLPSPPNGASDSRIESFAAWRRFLEAIAAEHALVLALEDLQWADDALLEFIDHVVEWSSTHPILVLCTTRPELLERCATWGGGKPNALTLSLPPLTDDDTGTLLGALLERDSADVGPELRARTGGNPLYAEQFARMIVERGSEGPSLPRTVQAVIGARLDALTPEEKQLVEDAAVAGTVFWPGAVAAIGELGRADAETLLHRLERKDLVERRHESTVDHELEYAFRHALVCDAAYERIPRGARAEKHTRAAEWLETAARTGDHAEALAYHYVHALKAARATGTPTGAQELRARVALRRAGERALALNAFATAAKQFRGALELWPRNDPDRPLLLLRLAQALWVTETGGEQELLEARDALVAEGNREAAAEAEALLCELYWFRADRTASWSHLDAAAALVRDAPPSPAKAYVLARLSRQLMLASSYNESIAVGREALALAERFGLDELRASTLNSIGSSRARAGDVDGMRDVEQAIEVALAGNSRAAVTAYNNLASLHGELGNLRRSYELLDDARQLAERLGDRAYLEWADRELGARSYATGDWDALIAVAQVRLAPTATPHYLDALLRCAHAMVLQARGDDDGAAAETARAEAEGRRVGDPQVLLACLADCAFVELLAGRVDAASARADEIQQLVGESNYLPPGASFELAVVLVECHRASELLALLSGLSQSNRWFDAARAYATGEYARAADLYADIGSAPAEAYVRARAAEALAAEGREDEAAAQRSRADAFYRSVGASRFLATEEAAATT